MLIRFGAVVPFLIILVFLGSSVVQNARADAIPSQSQSILYTNVIFKGYRLLIEHIELTNTGTDKKYRIEPYKASFLHHGVGKKQKDGFVFRELPAGRYYISKLIGDFDVLSSIRLQRRGSTIHIMEGYINYIGDITINFKRISAWGDGDDAKAKAGSDDWSHVRISDVDMMVNLDIKPDVDRVRDNISRYPSLFSDARLLFNVPGSMPFLVDPDK